MSRRSDIASRIAFASLVATIAWGAFAFGAVYPWAYWPLAAAATAIFALTPPAPLALSPVTTALTLVASGIALQLTPLDLEKIAEWSPETMRALRQLDLAVAAGAVTRHPLSIDPSRTALGLALFMSNALLIVASTRLFSTRGTRTFVGALTIAGVLLALVGIVQQPLWNGKIYGFWRSIDPGESYGPFVNKNHFAGWMLMALPLTLGLVCGRIARGFATVKPTWRDRLLWLSSSDANRLILLAFAAAVMALALMLTMSRSGISALALSLTITGAVVVHRQRGARRGALIAYFILLVLLAAGWTGVDVIAARFSAANWDEINGRRGAWADATDMARRFPLFGSGFNTYGVASVLYQRHDLAYHYNEAHNDYLQLAAEGGALVAVPTGIAVVCFVLLVRRRFAEETSISTYWLRVGAVAGLAAIAFQETVEFSLQMPGNAALFAAVCGIAIHRTPERKRSPQWRTAHDAARLG